MGVREWADRLAGAESRVVSYQDVWGAGRDWTPAYGPGGVTVEAALGLPPLLAAVDIIAGQVAAMPLQTFRQGAGGVKERATDGPLVVEPSTTWAADEWVYAAVASMLLHGEAMGLIVRNGTNGWPAQVEWIDPRKVTVEKQGGALAYSRDGEAIPADRVVHVRYGLLGPSSVRGTSPVSTLQGPLRTALAAATYEMNWFENGAHPSGILNVDVPELTESQAETIIDRFMKRSKSRKPVALSKIASYQMIQSIPEAAGLEPARKRIATDVANVFHLPPEMVGGDRGSSMTYATLETDQAALEVRALMPVYTRLERAITRLTPRPVFVRFNADRTVRTDLRTRAEVGEILLRSGQRSPDEVRAKDDLGPIPSGVGGEFAWSHKANDGQMTTRELAEAVQKIYLGVGPVLSPSEAREILNRDGAGLPDALPPDVAVPVSKKGA